MKKKIVISSLCVLLSIWVLSIIFARILTDKHFEEFFDLEKVGCTHMLSCGENPQFRVLSYGKDYATVYYFSPSGGEKMQFVNSNSGWKYNKTISTWSSSGSADSFFCWPYYKCWVI